MDRRAFVSASVRTLCYGGIVTSGLSGVVGCARVGSEGRFVFVLLRGGLDGLAAIVPFGDPAYASLRGPMAFDESALTPLDDVFGLAPGLAPLMPFWDDGELAALHAMAIPQRTRSHFDAQAVLETGLAQKAGSSDGWLNRLLQVMSGERSGIAIASGMPLSLIGPHEVQSWSPAELGVVDDPFLSQLASLYRTDAGLQDRFEAALEQRDLLGEEPIATLTPGNGVTPLMQATARILGAEKGPNIAAMEFSGWDTHMNQDLGGGLLDERLGQLAEGLVALRHDMGTAWAKTTVVVMTEFGRTARANMGSGTDHGTAGAGLVIGPGIARSKVVADWPGLSDGALYEGRDLQPSLDTRAVLKAVVMGTFDLTRQQADRVFPGSGDVSPLPGLMG